MEFDLQVRKLLPQVLLVMTHTLLTDDEKRPTRSLLGENDFGLLFVLAFLTHEILTWIIPFCE